MTIDEAIEKHRKMAEMHRNDIVPKEDYHNMPWIDKENELNMRSAEEHEQLAEWLEELKCYKNDNDFSDYADRLHKIAFSSGYNKAIDDFVKSIVDRGLSANDDKYCITHYDNYLKVIKELAEQLKAGGKE